MLLALCGALAGLVLAGCDPPSKYGSLQIQWTYETGDTIAATPKVGDGKVYVGSWDGYEYALAEATGAVTWRTFLGQIPHRCDTVGVTSAPVLLNGFAYLGGGDDKWYALNATTGAVAWTVPTGSTSTGHYNWSSPSVHNGHAYVGISSLCDEPLVQGKLLRVNLATHQIVNTWKVVPDGQLGGTIWTKPVVDAARNTVFVTTGNRAYTSVGNTQVHAEALVAVDATTLAIKGFWSLPVSDPTPDADWGTAPVMFTDSTGRDLVAAANKNGVLYAFRRDNVSAGPVWFKPLSEPAAGSDPAAGGVYSNGWFDGQRLYWAGGRTTIRGTVYDGSVRALDPRTGDYIWERQLPKKTLGALDGANGMIAVPSMDAVRVVDAANGDVLYSKKAIYYAGPTIANGRMYLGDFDGFMRAFTYPSSPGPPAGGGAAAISVASAPLDCSQPDGCEVVLRQGCQRLERVPSLADATQLRVVKAGGAPTTVALYNGDRCAGRPLLTAPLGSAQLLLPVPKAYRVTPGRFSVRSSARVRVGIDVIPK